MMIISAAATGLHAWLVRPALDEVLIKGDKEMLIFNSHCNHCCDNV